MDLRERDFLQRYPDVFTKLKEEGYLFEILFLEASTEALLRRYSQTRRKHPLSEKKSLLEGIQAEREELKGLDMGKGMKEAIERMADGEDPEKVEEEMGDVLEEDPFALPGKKVIREKSQAPFKDETLYDL
ncbi:unnamed protein product [marine sediment metagenome]|uniref:RapZ-like N-terminal domain-containing protein n=1 Tax=marine sediment metagenome TaxID=412755 RepID=X1JXA4_9ZZZZ